MPNDLTLSLKIAADAKEAVSAGKDTQTALTGVGQAAQTAQYQVEKLDAAQKSLSTSSTSKDAQVALTGMGQAAQTAQSQVEKLDAAQKSLSTASHAAAGAAAAASTATQTLGETEAQAAARIRAMVTASLDQVAAQNALSQSLSTGTGRAGQQVLSLEQIAAGNRRAAEASRAHAVAMAETSADTTKLIDKYDPLGAKLKSLQADFESLNKAAAAGAISTADLGKVDAAYAKISAQIAATESAMAGASGNVTAGFNQITDGATQSGLMTQAVTENLVTLGREVVTGNFSRIPGTFLRLAQHIGMSGAQMGALVGVIGGVAAAAGVLALAIHQVSEEAKGMDRALAFTNNFSAQTRDGMLSLADSVASSGRISVATSRDIVTQLAASGKIGASAFADVARLTADYAHLSGQSADSVTKDMIRLFADPAAGARELDGTLGGLSIAELERIDRLTRTGQVVEAQTLFVAAYQKALEGNTTALMTQIPWYEQWGTAASNAWKKVADAATPMGDLAVGKQIEVLRTNIGMIRLTLPESKWDTDPYIALLKARLAVLEDVRRAEKNETAMKAEADKKDAYEKATAAIIYQNSVLFARQKTLEQIARLETASLPAGTDAAKYRTDAIDGLKKGLNEGQRDKKASGDDTAYLNAVAARIKSEADLEYTLQDVAGKSQLKLLDMQYKAQLIAESDYLAQKQALAQAGADAAVKRVKAEIAAEQNAYDKATKPADKERHGATLNKLQGDLAKANQAATDVGLTEQYRVIAENDKALKAYADAIESLAKPYEDQAKSLAIQVQNYRLSNEQIALNSVAMLDGARAAATLNGAVELQVAPWERQIDALKRVAGAYRILRIRKAEAEQQAAVDKKEEALTSAMGTADDYATTLKGRNRLLDEQISLYSQSTISINAESTAQRILNAQTKVQVDLEEKLRALYKQGLSETSEAAERIRALAAEEKLKIASVETAKATHAQWQKGWEETDKIARQAFDSWGQKGVSVAEQIGKSLKSALMSAIYEATIRPIAFQVYNAATGALGMSPGGATGAMSMMGNASNLYGFTGPGGYASQGGAWMDGVMGTTGSQSAGYMAMQQTAAFEGSQASMLAAQTAEFGQAGAALTDAAAGAGAGMAEGFLAGIGPLGWAAIAGSLVIGSGVLDHKGGPKTEWYGGQNASAFPGHDGANGLRDTVRSASVDAAANAGVATFNALIARFGGSAAMKLRLAGDSDPNGDAPDTVGYAMSLNGGQLYQGAKNFGRGEGEKNLPEMVSRALLEGVKRSDFAGVSGEIIKGITTGLDAASISTDLLAQSNAALSGVADLFGLSLSPIQASFAALKSTSNSLSTSFTAAGITGDVTTESIKRYVSALDLSATAGQDAARAALALEPAVRTYQSSISALFGVTADSLKADFYDAIHNSKDVASAGEALATTVMDGIQSTMQGDMASRLSDITLNGIINPIMSGMMQGYDLARIMADGTVEAAVQQLEKTAKIYEAVMQDPRIVEILGGIKKSLGGTDKSPTPTIWGSVSKDAADAAKPADDAAKKRADDAKKDDAKKAAEDAAKNAEDLKKQMSDVAYARQSIGMDALSKSLLDAAKATDEAIAKARALAATESDLNQIRALGTEQTRKLIDDAAMSAYKSLDTAQGGGLQTLYDPANAKTDQATAMGGLAASLGITSDVLDTIIAQSGGLLKAGIQYWDNLSVAQQQAVIKAAESQAAVIEANQKAWDAQLAITTKIQGWIDSVTNFSKGIDSDIFGIKYNLPGADQAGMLAAKKSDLQTQFDSYQGNPGGWNSEDMQHQLDIAGQIKDVTLQRMTLESGNATKMLDFTRGIGDYLKNLRLSELSPLTNAKKMAEAQSQFADVVNVLNDSTASAAAKDLARSKLESKADAYLKTGRDYYASSDDYTAIYQQVTGTLEQMGADTGTDAERQLKVTQTLVDKASSSIKELEALKTVAGTGLSALGALLKPELTHLGEIANTLGANGGLTKVLTDLPKGISDALSPYLDAGNRPAAIAATVSGHAPSTGITKGSEFSAADIKDSALRWYGSPAPGFEDAALRSVYDWAVNRGVKSEQIDAAFGNATGTAAAIAKAHGWPAFAAGGYHAGGMALVGEHGAEVVDFGAPAHITPADQTRNLMSRLGQRGDDGALIAELKALRAEVAALRAERRQDTGAAIDATVRSNAAAADVVAKAVTATAQSRQSRAGAPA